MKKVLIYGLYDWNNLGDDLMMFCINNKLKEKNIEPYFIKSHQDNYFKFERKYDNTLYLDKKYKNRFLDAFSKIIQLLKFFRKKNEYEALIFMGGGYINRSIGSGYGKLIYMFVLKKIFNIKNKKVYFTGQTVGPIFNVIDKFFIKHIYSNAKVFVRENNSYNLLKQINIKSELTGDDAFLINSITCNEQSTKKEKYILVNYKYFYGYENIFDDYIKLIKKIANKSGYNIVLIPFRNKKEYKEYYYHEKIKKILEINNIKVRILETSNVFEIMEYFKNAELVIGTAYHCVVLALINNTKIYCGYIGEYYKIKMTGILDFYFKGKKYPNYDLEIKKCLMKCIKISILIV